MALCPFTVGGSYIFDPFNVDSLLCGGRADAGSKDVSNYARDVAAVGDWKETDDAHIFKADLPGLAKDEVKVQVEDGRGVLQISGECKKEETTPGEKWHRVERYCGRFLRRFRLPDNAKVEELKAEMENGVLTVTVPKVQKPAPRTIDIACN